MSDLIIAPTIAFTHKTPTASIVDAVNPYSNENVVYKEKLVPMTPQSPANVPREMQNKRVVNLESVKMGSEDIDLINRQRAEYEQITQKKNMTYFPDTGIVNGQIIGGSINNDMR